MLKRQRNNGGGENEAKFSCRDGKKGWVPSLTDKSTLRKGVNTQSLNYAECDHQTKYICSEA